VAAGRCFRHQHAWFVCDRCAGSVAGACALACAKDDASYGTRKLSNDSSGPDVALFSSPISCASVRVQEQEDVRLVLKAACDMLAELSAAHNPKNYSNLYAEVFTHLQQLPVRPRQLHGTGTELCSPSSRVQLAQHPCSISFKIMCHKEMTHTIVCTALLSTRVTSFPAST
jgi:hypothetical protein